MDVDQREVHCWDLLVALEVRADVREMEDGTENVSSVSRTAEQERKVEQFVAAKVGDIDG